MRRRRVLVVSHACVIDENQRLLARLNLEPDLEVGLVAPRSWKTDLRGLQGFTRLDGFDGRVFLLRPVFNGQGTLHFYRRAGRAVRDFRPDVVHIDEEPWSLAAWQFAELGAKAGAKVVFHTKENLRKWYPIPFRVIERRVFALSTCAFVMSTEAGDVLRSKGFAKPICTLPHAVDPEQFAPRDASALRRELGLQGTVVAYVGRISAEKGVLDLIDALGILPTNGRLAPVSALLIGSGALEEEVKRRAESLGVAPRMRILSSVPHRDMARYYNCADIIVAPSRTVPRWKEQFGRVLIEAMASGCAVIGSDSGEIPHLIRETGGGVAFPEGNVGALAEAIRGLVDAADMRRRYAARGREAVLKLYSYSTVAARARDVYRRLEDVPCTLP